MSTRSWLRNLFARPATRTIRRAPRRARLAVEVLEDRVTPTLLYHTPIFAVGSSSSATIDQANTTTNVAASTNGDIYVAYGGNSVQVARSLDRGQTFQPSVRLANVSTPWVAVAAQGDNVYVGWVVKGASTGHDSAYVSVSTDDGATFSSPQTVTTTGDFSLLEGGISLAVYGSDFYVQSTSPGTDVYRNSHNGIGSYTSASVPSENYMKLQVDPTNGDVYSLGDTAGSLKDFKSTNNGATFSAQALSNPDNVEIAFSTAASSFGPAGDFAFIAGGQPGYDPFRNDYNPGGVVAARINLATNAVTSLSLQSELFSGRSLAADEIGNLVDSYNQSGSLMYEVSQDLGTSFAAPVTVASGVSSNVAINPHFQDVLVLYQDASHNLFLNVYQNELKTAELASTTNVTGGTFTYDGTPHAGSGSVDVPGGVVTLSYVGINGTVYSSVTAPTNAGTYTVTATFAGDDTHTGSSSSADLTINKANATITVTPYRVTYDGKAHTATYTLSGVHDETGAAVGTVMLSTTHTGAGTYVGDSWSFTGTANYNGIARTAITDVIKKAVLTITARDATRAYGAGNPTFAFAESGFAKGDGPAVVRGSPPLSTTANAASPPGRYAITVDVSALTADNYTFVPTPGILTVTPAALSASGVTFHALAGTPFAGAVATFHNADPFGGASSYVAVISWGDGTWSYGAISGSGATLTVGGTHTYSGPLVAPVYVQIRHKLGDTTVATALGTATVVWRGPQFGEFWPW